MCAADTLQILFVRTTVSMTLFPDAAGGGPEWSRCRCSGVAKAAGITPLYRTSCRGTCSTGGHARTLLCPSVLQVPSAVHQNVFGIVGFLEGYASRGRSDKVHDIAQKGADAVPVQLQASSAAQRRQRVRYKRPQLHSSPSCLGYVPWRMDIQQTVCRTYGMAERSKFVPQEYASGGCNSCARLGARGIGVLYASGNTRVGRQKSRVPAMSTSSSAPCFPVSRVMFVCQAHEGSLGPLYLTAPTFTGPLAHCCQITGYGPDAAARLSWWRLPEMHPICYDLCSYFYNARGRGLRHRHAPGNVTIYR